MSEQPTKYIIGYMKNGDFIYAPQKPKRRNRKREMLAALQAGHQLSGKDIWQRFGIYRASGIVKQLRDEGHSITCRMESLPDGRRYGVYFIEK
jgi:hypothetical protein